ncbi:MULTISPECIES: YsnF/AvaK domain-containing protein [Ramlibacter]|uniref:DUF2382 domain-containing protein n=1 Tax=Ramlibacter aquaticus TaxID=2780094 RepID=A0ABR9SGC0_9BURK|nr:MULTISPECIES: YsnF/AvaK domain-containing protein [Ramlibacter]MBE7941234.1 DUF2382 domain-containing protein [Ramlibacter aquaticus]
MQTGIGAFDDRTQAEQAVEQLVADGFDRSDIHIEDAQGSSLRTEESATTQAPRHHGFFAWLFGDSDEHESHRQVYSEAVRRGSVVVVADAEDETRAQQAIACLHDAGAIDVNERARQWRAEGAAERMDTPRQAPVAGQTAGRDEGVLDVVQEELRIGKRQMEKGGVRVVQRVSEKPVREIVKLREEEAVVDRRPVDREATAGDLNTFKEGTLEVREMAEEPVVAKTARVVEEVRVGKQVREREQTVEDTVRRKDVEVERLDATRERERAVAADPERDRLANRDPLAERDAPASGTPRKEL